MNYGGDKRDEQISDGGIFAGQAVLSGGNNGRSSGYMVTSVNLDIYELDFQSDDRQLRLLGAVPSSEPFNGISWGGGPTGSEEFGLGLIAGGLNDGNVGVWNPVTLVRMMGMDVIIIIPRLVCNHGLRSRPSDKCYESHMRNWL